MGGGLRVAPLACLLALGTMGCGTAATLEVRDGPSVNGRIVENRDGWLVARTDDGDAFVREEIVEDIEHPGVTAMAIGGMLVAVMAPIFAVTVATDDGFSKLIGPPAALWTGVGIGMVVWGFDTHETSRARAQPKDHPPPWEQPRTRLPESRPDPNWLPL